MKALRTLGLLLLVALPALSQQTWTTVKEWDTGPDSNRLNIVILGDGYTAAQMPLFRAHVTAFINKFVSKEPMATYKNTFNIYRVEVKSNQSGSDKPGACYTPEVLVDTELDSKYCTGGTQRCITCDTQKALGTAFINVPSYDEVLVVVNDPEYGGCAGTVACYTGVHSSATNIAVHEAGHSIFGLADEYWSSGTTYTGSEPNRVNVSTYDSATMLANQSKWHHWIGIEGVSTFQGGYYNEFGIYRPSSDCSMRSSAQPFCPVCRERAVEVLWGHVLDVEAMNPPQGTHVSYDSDLSIDVVAPQPNSTLTFEWYVDNVLAGSGTQSTANGMTTASFNAGSLLVGASGYHYVFVRTYDSTSYYRGAVPLAAVAPKLWIASDQFPDLEAASIALPNGVGTSGELFDVSATVNNLGNVPSTPVRVGVYSSIDGNVTTADELIGEYQLGALATGTSAALTIRARISASIVATTRTLGVIVDDQEALIELDESNNYSSFPGQVTAAPNHRLGISQVIMHFAINDQIDFTIDGGGASAAGNGYYLIPTQQMTGAGTSLGPLVGSLSITIDALSIASMSGAIGFPFFQDFTGVLNANGQGTAHFWTPAIALSVPPSLMRFGAVTTAVNPTTGSLEIVLVTNSVSVLLL